MSNYWPIQIIKSLDTFFIAGWYFISSIVLSRVIDRIFPDFNEENYNQKTTVHILFEIVVSLWLFLLLSRLIRVVFVDHLFSPFEGNYGYQRRLTKEATGGVIFAFSLFNYSANLKKRVTYFGKRIGLIPIENTPKKIDK